MTWRSPKFFFVVSAILICAGIGFKVLRYRTVPQRMDVSFETRLAEFLDQHGWTRQPNPAYDNNKAVRILSFKKENCAEPIWVSIVGTTGGLESYLRQTFGDDLAFVQHGTVREHPSLMRFQFTTTWRRMVSRIFGTPMEQRPILGITPAPKDETGTCRGPSTAQWQSL